MLNDYRVLTTDYPGRPLFKANNKRFKEQTMLNDHHLGQGLKEYLSYYNQARPHQGVQQYSPVPYSPCKPEETIRYRAVMGGLIRDYYREVA